MPRAGIDVDARALPSGDGGLDGSDRGGRDMRVAIADMEGEGTAQRLELGDRLLELHAVERHHGGTLGMARAGEHGDASTEAEADEGDAAAAGRMAREPARRRDRVIGAGLHVVALEKGEALLALGLGV